ncbi:hypothetical protein [Nocardioides convexus]|uniref:hypothetical protein n=1 Tax=Nocardioides convexus TaxID=2712224 RepID=UPI00241885E3|nr:hypothetical protein [Nocardioides convexus]
MSDIKIVIQSADVRQDSTVTEGTKAWEPVPRRRRRDRGPGGRRAQGPVVRAGRRRRGRGREDRQP